MRSVTARPPQLNNKNFHPLNLYLTPPTNLSE